MMTPMQIVVLMMIMMGMMTRVIVIFAIVIVIKTIRIIIVVIKTIMYMVISIQVLAIHIQRIGVMNIMMIANINQLVLIISRLKTMVFNIGMDNQTQEMMLVMLYGVVKNTM
jgi:hypothetical protein